MLRQKKDFGFWTLVCNTDWEISKRERAVLAHKVQTVPIKQT